MLVVGTGYIHTSQSDEMSLQMPLRSSGWSISTMTTHLVDMSRLKKVDDGTTLIMTVIDVFSTLAWCVALKNNPAASLWQPLHSC